MLVHLPQNEICHILTMKLGMEALVPVAARTACGSETKASEDPDGKNNSSNDEVFFSFFHFLVLLSMLYFSCRLP